MAKTIWLIWDGASHALIVDMLARGMLPHLQRVVARGACTATMPPGPNSETPPGLMTLFTGYEEPDHGTPGFLGAWPATAEHSILESSSGFAAHWLRQPPVWVAAAAAGRTVALVCTAFAPDPLLQTPYPWPYPTPAYQYVMDGYNRELARPQLLALEARTTPLTVAERAYEVKKAGSGYAVYSVPNTARPHLTLTQPEQLVPLWTDREAGIGAYLSLIRVPGTPGGDWLWCSSTTQMTMHPAQTWPLELGPFLGAGIGWYFSRSASGKGPQLTLDTLTSITCQVAQYFGELAVQTLARHPTDFMVCYQPAIDEMLHQTLREALADWPHGSAARALIAVHQAVDHQLGRLLEGVTAEDTLYISSDHGHEPIQWSLRPNVLLRQAGLLTLKGDKVDLEHTRALFHSSGWVLINRTERQGGIVTPAEYEATLHEVECCLGSATDPATGQSLGLQHSRTLWQGQAPAPGDLFLWGPPHVELRSYLFGTVGAPPEVGGHHQTSLHTSPYLAALFAGCGPGIAGVPLPTRNAGVAALIRQALGL